MGCKLNSICLNISTGTDSILVVLGGFGTHQNLVDTVESFCSKTDTWTKLPVSQFLLPLLWQ